jgi:hypothetical protein
MLWMADPLTDRDSFRHSQLPFRFAVESFSHRFVFPRRSPDTFCERYFGDEMPKAFD